MIVPLLCYLCIVLMVTGWLPCWNRANYYALYAFCGENVDHYVSVKNRMALCATTLLSLYHFRKIIRGDLYLVTIRKPDTGKLRHIQKNDRGLPMGTVPVLQWFMQEYIQCGE